MGRLILSETTRSDMQRASWIRKMFTRAGELKREKGAHNVFDYSLGNPGIEPPSIALKRLQDLVASPTAGMHGYMPNAGFESVRAKVAEHVSRSQQLEEGTLTANHIVMTVGAAGALSIILEIVLDLGDEVIVPTPYFGEYNFYISRHRGNLVPVPTRNDFQLDLDQIEAKITQRTKVILINNPNNPTGAVYSDESLRQLAEIITKKEKEYGHDILLVTDEPYAGLVYDGAVVPPVLNIFPHSFLATSHSKDLGLPGERIGYFAINPSLNDSKGVLEAAEFASRALGFVNAPALMQMLVADLQGLTGGLAEYQARRDLLYAALIDYGYAVVKPQGTFYVFPKSPIPDDVAFVEAALAHNLLFVPGKGFGSPGYFRISYSNISLDHIAKSLPFLKKLAEQFGL
ncbi:MAG: pyridoxal phosphate-dependent aminotransferase [Candidatus Margulisbacteria bacterium]|nr:pyridoxal phosphate-dependent aminotransferase [Candidatus Margulisiibacteriota bacterium]